MIACRGNKKRTGRNKSKDTAGGGGGSINQQPLSPNTSEVNHKTAAAADDAAAAVAAATSTADQHDAVTTSTELLDKAVIDAEDDEASKAGAKTMRKDSEASSGADSSGKPKSKPAKKSQFSRGESAALCFCLLNSDAHCLLFISFCILLSFDIVFLVCLLLHWIQYYRR